MSAPVVPSIAPTQLLRVRDGFVLHQALYAVAKLGVADLVEDGRHHISELAAELKVNDSALYRTLRLLASSKRPPRVLSATRSCPAFCALASLDRFGLCLFFGEANSITRALERSCTASRPASRPERNWPV